MKHPTLKWAPPPKGEEHKLARLMLGPWVLGVVIGGGAGQFLVLTELPLKTDSQDNSLRPTPWARFKSLEEAKTEVERIAALFLGAVHLIDHVRFPDRTIRTPRILAPVGRRRLDL